MADAAVPAAAVPAVVGVVWDSSGSCSGSAKLAPLSALLAELSAAHLATGRPVLFTVWALSTGRCPVHGPRSRALCLLHGLTPLACVGAALVPVCEKASLEDAQRAAGGMVYDGGTDLSLLDQLPEDGAGTGLEYALLVSDGIDNHGSHRQPALLRTTCPIHCLIAKGGAHGTAPQALRSIAALTSGLVFSGGLKEMAAVVSGAEQLIVCTGVRLEGVTVEQMLEADATGGFATVPDCRLTASHWQLQPVTDLRSPMSPAFIDFSRFLPTNERSWAFQDGAVHFSGTLPPGFAPAAATVSLERGGRTATFRLQFDGAAVDGFAGACCAACVRKLLCESCHVLPVLMPRGAVEMAVGADRAVGGLLEGRAGGGEAARSAARDGGQGRRGDQPAGRSGSAAGSGGYGASVRPSGRTHHPAAAA